MTDIEFINNELAEKRAELEKLENNENTEEYDDFIDELYPVIDIGVLFSPSRVLKELDPIAYDCGLNDYNDNRISELQDEIEELEEEKKEIGNA